MNLRRFAESIHNNGWAIAEDVIAEAALAAVEADIAPIVASSMTQGGIRNLLDESRAVAELAQSTALRAIACSVLGAACGVVRVVYFDKTPDTNWRVIWHQDLTIAVQSEHATPGYGPWSEKAGVVRVKPGPAGPFFPCADATEVMAASVNRAVPSADIRVIVICWTPCVVSGYQIT